MKADNLLLLASQSPRRRELLAQIGVRFRVLDVDVPEVREAGETAHDYVCRLAEAKARAGSRLWPDAAVMGADTIVVHNNAVLEKPRDQTDALRMLSRLSGSRHHVYSAVSICRGSQQATRLVTTEVTFRSLTEAEIAAYWNTGEPQDKAGSYAIQGFGAVFVENLSGSYSGVVGLPLAETQALLAQFNIGWWQQNL